MQKIFFILILFLLIFMPSLVWAKYICNCTGTALTDYADEAECNQYCKDFCVLQGGGGVCREAGICETNPDAPGCGGREEQGGGREEQGSGREEQGGGHEESIPSAKLDNPIGISTIPEVISRLIKIMLGLVGTVSLVVFIYAGFLWITANGKPDQITQGKNAMLWAVVGIVVVFSSYAILKYVFNVLSF